MIAMIVIVLVMMVILMMMMLMLVMLMMVIMMMVLMIPVSIGMFQNAANRATSSRAYEHPGPTSADMFSL